MHARRTNFYRGAILSALYRGWPTSFLAAQLGVVGRCQKVPYYDINMNYVLSPTPPPSESHNLTRRGGQRCFARKNLPRGVLTQSQKLAKASDIVKTNINKYFI